MMFFELSRLILYINWLLSKRVLGLLLAYKIEIYTFKTIGYFPFHGDYDHYT